MHPRELTAILLLVVGVVMAFIALFLPPPGEISDSVLLIFGQILIYCGSIFGLDSYFHALMEQTIKRKSNADLRQEKHLDDSGGGDCLRSERPARQPPD